MGVYLNQITLLNFHREKDQNFIFSGLAKL